MAQGSVASLSVMATYRDEEGKGYFAYVVVYLGKLRAGCQEN